MIRLILSPITITCACAAFLHVLVYYSGYTFTPGTLADPDGYMRLLRVQQLLETGQWYDQSITLANAPYGHTLPWGRLLDLLILMVYYPLSWVKDSGQALFTAGVWVSPLLLIPGGLALAWAKRNYQLSHDFCLAALAMYLMQPALVNYYVAGRPDHHALLITLFLIQLIVIYGCLRKGSSVRDFVIAGVLMGGSCWVSIEPLAMWVASTLVFSLLWLRQPDRIRQVIAFHAATLVAATAVLLLETPGLLWSDPAVDRLSGYYLLLFLVVLLGWCGIFLFSRKVLLHQMVQRMGVGVITGLVSVGIIYWLATPITSGPMGALPPEILSIWLPRLDEFQPVGTTFSGVLKGVLTWMPVVILALPYVGYRCICCLKQKISPSLHDYAWVVYAVIFTGLIFYQKRWSSYADIIWLIPAALLVGELLTWLSVRQRLVIWRVPALFLLLVVPFIPQVLFSHASEAETASAMSSQTVYREDELLRWAADLSSSRTLLAPFNLSPQLMYRTGHRTVGGNYHTNPEGIIDSYEFLMTSDEVHARQILESRAVDYVIVESTAYEAGFAVTELAASAIFKRLLKGELPEFLEFEKTVGGYQVFRVELSSPGG